MRKNFGVEAPAFMAGVSEANFWVEAPAFTAGVSVLLLLSLAL